MIDLAMLEKTPGAMQYKKNAVILRDRDVGIMHIIVKGQIGIYQNSLSPLSVLTAGDYFGEQSLFLNRAYGATAVALEETVTLRVDIQNHLFFFRLYPELITALLASLCARLEYSGVSSAMLLVGGRIPDAMMASPPTNGGPAAPPPAATSDAGTSIRPPSATPVISPAACPCSLFPEGHGSYTLPIDNTKSEYLLERGYTCPLCRHDFKTLGVKKYKLVNERTDPDMRVRYKNIEPLYYDVVTCPKCWYSAPEEIFSKANIIKKNDVNRVLADCRAEILIQHGYERDTFAVFAGYYMALLCVPLCFPQSMLTTGRLWIKLGRLYDDCGDEAMSRYAAEHALTDFMAVYQETYIEGGQLAQVCLLIGELNFKLGQYNEARNYFHMAKTNRSAGGLVKQQADIRIDTIRELMHEATV